MIAEHGVPLLGVEGAVSAGGIAREEHAHLLVLSFDERAQRFYFKHSFRPPGTARPTPERDSRNREMDVGGLPQEHLLESLTLLATEVKPRVERLLLKVR